MDKKKLLIIDDEQNLCSLMEDMLSDDYTVFTSTQGAQGIQLAQTKKPDLIFLDMVMPDLAGPEIAKRLAQDPQTQKIPVVVMTAKLYEDEQVRLIKQQPNVRGILNKPCTLAILQNKIKEILG